MSTQQDIYAVDSKSRPPMLNKENYVPWSSRLLRYAKNRPNGKLIHNSILNGPYVRKMIPEPGDANRDITVSETFHLQTDDELSDKELKQIEADDQAIRTILLGLLEDIYDAEKKAKLFNEWERFTSNEGESIESYYHRFLKLMNDLKRNKHFPEKIAIVCAMCKKCLIFVNHDKCLSKNVNGKNSCGNNQKAKVSVKEIQKKYQPKVAKLKKVGTRESIATPKPRKPRLLLRWSPTGRLFDQEGKLAAFSNSESQYDCSNGDNACTSNAMEPKIKRFPNSTSLLDKLFRFVYGQFCDLDLEVAFRRNACFVRNLKGVDLLKGDRS
nr:hypothetical protein [Tanacetum cinerariifolium]